MTDHPVHETTSLGGKFVLRTPGHEAAELTYRTRAEGVVVADHTFVPDSLRGQGIAGKLLSAFMAFVAENNLKVVPQCSYVAASFARKKEWQAFQAS